MCEHIIKINFNPLFAFFKISTKKLSVTYGTCIRFLLDYSVLDYKATYEHFLK